jgi:uncharacterized membrane protein
VKDNIESATFGNSSNSNFFYFTILRLSMMQLFSIIKRARIERMQRYFTAFFIRMLFNNTIRLCADSKTAA